MTDCMPAYVDTVRKKHVHSGRQGCRCAAGCRVETWEWQQERSAESARCCVSDAVGERWGVQRTSRAGQSLS